LWRSQERRRSGTFFLRRERSESAVTRVACWKSGEGGGEAVGVGKFVFAFQFGREAGLFHADGNDIYWQLGNLFDHVPGDSRAAGAPDGIVSFSPVYDAHCEAGFSGTGLLKQSDQLFGAGAILVNGDDRAAPSTKRFNNRAPRGAFRLGKSIAPTSHF
jgi:hypothetical protein